MQRFGTIASTHLPHIHWHKKLAITMFFLGPPGWLFRIWGRLFPIPKKHRKNTSSHKAPKSQKSNVRMICGLLVFFRTLWASIFRRFPTHPQNVYLKKSIRRNARFCLAKQPILELIFDPYFMFWGISFLRLHFFILFFYKIICKKERFGDPSRVAAGPKMAPIIAHVAPKGFQRYFRRSLFGFPNYGSTSGSIYNVFWVD